jgi:hypothetical protein
LASANGNKYIKKAPLRLWLSLLPPASADRLEIKKPNGQFIFRTRMSQVFYFFCGNLQHLRYPRSKSAISFLPLLF